VIGGGFGGTIAAKAIDEFAHVSLIEPRDTFVHDVAALRALAAPEHAVSGA
jgi:NADH dehydrogenase FAD-containing subunit